MKLNILTYSKETGLTEISSIEELRQVEYETAWIDIETPNQEDFNGIAQLFELHELTVEDCFTPNHSPKIESFQNYDFFVFRSLKYGTALEESLASDDWDEIDEQHTWALNIYMGYKFIITHRRDEVPWLDATYRLVEQTPQRIFTGGVDTLIHKILDVLITRFMRSLRYYEMKLDTFETQVIDQTNDFNMSEMLDLKRDLTGIKQIMMNQRAIFSRLSADSSLISSRQLRRYFRDLDDQAIAILKLIDKHVETLINIRDAYFAMTNVKLGDVMRILAVITTIGTPLNIMVGLYGMNFRVLPMAQNPLGFWFIIACMLFLIVSMLLLFRYRRWL